MLDDECDRIEYRKLGIMRFHDGKYYNQDDLKYQRLKNRGKQDGK